MTAKPTWQERFSETVGRAINNARGAKSDQWIADETAKLEHPISRTAVSEYRRGKRKTIPVTDLIVLARVLEVPPVTLLFPDLPNGMIPAMPPGQSEVDDLRTDSDVPAFDALRWFTGESRVVPHGVVYGEDPETGELRSARVSFDYQFGSNGLYPAFAKRSKQADLLDACRNLSTAHQKFNAAMRRYQIELSTEPKMTKVDAKLHLDIIKSLEEDIERYRLRVEELGGDLSVIDNLLGEHGDD